MAKNHKENLSLKVKDVYASLKHGQIYSEKIWVVVSIIMLAMAGLLLIVIIINGVNLAVSYEINELYVLITMCLIEIGFLLLGLMFLFVPSHYKRKTKYWIKDAILLDAKCILLDYILIVRHGLSFKAAAIQVNFSYNGDSYIRRSEYRGKLLHLKIFNKYVDKNIMIAYSPKYDEVMLLK